MRHVRGRLAAAAAALLLAGCGAPGLTSSSPSQTATSSTASSTSTASSSTPTDTASPSGGAQGTLSWHACSGGVQCATLTVPLDHSKPDGPTIQIAVDRLPARDPAHRIGALLTNPGGPGASGLDAPRSQASLFTGLLSRFDIVGFDPRGVNQSDPVHCVGKAALEQTLHADPIADDTKERAELIATSKALADGCGQSAGDILAHVGTEEAARDMDDLRVALGESKLTYLGFSYGTFLGATYAKLFPTHVRALVLDGDLDPKLNAVEITDGQSASMEDELNRFVAHCLAGGSCELGNTAASAKAFLENLFVHIDASPLHTGGRIVGRSEVITALVIGFYEPSIWDQLPTIFAAAASGDGSGILTLFDLVTGRRSDGTYTNEVEANTAINCLDRPVAGVAELDADAAHAAAVAPHFGTVNLYGLTPCAFWPVRNSSLVGPLHVTGAPPILLVGSTHDPATPYRWSQSLQTQIDGSVLITRDGDGHTGYPNSSCIHDAVNAYLLDLTLPAAGTVCPSTGGIFG